MENVYIMRKTVLTAVIFFILGVVVFSQTRGSAGTEKADVTARAGKQSTSSGEVVRMVFESEEAFIKKANVFSSGMQLNVEFPSVFNLKPQKGFNFETSIKDRVLIINIKEPFEIKVLRLSSPPRLVIDILSSKSKGTTDTKPQSEVVLSQKVFVLDPGHGGYDFGIISDDLKEKDIALSIAKDIEGLLIKKGKKVYLTKRSDQFMSLKDRAVLANQKMPEIFLSIHVSASENFVVYTPEIADTSSEMSIAELYSLSSRQKRYVKKSIALAENIGKAIKEEFNLNVVQREMSLPILNSVGAPAILIEVPSFKIMSYDQKTLARLAEAVIKGFSYYAQ